MSEQTQIVPIQATQQIVSAPLPPPPAANPLTAVHGALRGRYRWVVPLALILAAVGAQVGYRVLPDQLDKLATKYDSVALIRIRAVLPKMMGDQSSVMPMFDAFVESQVMYIQSRRVIDQAMQRPDWKALGRGTSPAAVAAFMQSLRVDHPRNSEMIRVTFTDRIPDAAAAGARSIVEAYEAIYVEDDIDGAKKMRFWEDRRAALDLQLKSANTRIQDLARESGSDNLQPSYDFWRGELNRLESELLRVQLSLGVVQSERGASPTTAPARTSIEEIAAVDARTQDALKRKLEAEKQLSVMKLDRGENHPSVVHARAVLNLLGDELSKAADDFLARNVGAQISASGGNGSKSLISVYQLRAQEAALKVLYGQLSAKVLELGRRNEEMRNLRTDTESLRSKLNEANARIEQMNAESAFSGRLQVMSRGDRPDLPSTDRRMALAAGGGFGGVAVAVGVFLLLGLADRRFRYLADAEATSLRQNCRVLGVIPTLEGDLSDREQAGLAAHCVHHIRTLLQIHSRTTGQRVFAITSPSSGDGKTSLSVALGLSSAASGCRTLLIDCDILGAGLTARLMSTGRPAIGNHLVESGVITEAQLGAAWQFALRSRKPLADALVETGAARRADIDRAIADAGAGRLGLLDVLGGMNINRCIIEAATPGLCILPIGSIGQQAHISPDAIQEIIEQVRSAFDLVLIDTGPVLGSLEAAMAATSVDGVVLMVSRGEQRPLAQKAMEQLQEVGAELVGIVFNRARPNDLDVAAYSSRVSGRSAGSVATVNVDGQRAAQYATAGPVASAVASASWSSDQTQ